MRSLLSAFFLSLIVTTWQPHGHAFAQDEAIASFETRAPHAILIDVDARTTLFEKAAREPMKPASMAKVLTLAVIFDAMANGEITPETRFEITEDAWRRGGAPSRGSTMFAEIHSEVAVADLIKGIAVHSANDAAIAVAQGMSGSEEAFAKRMNTFGQKIGMTGSNFKNATGLPDPDQFSTARDLAVLTLHVVENYPEQSRVFAQEDFTWNDIFQRSRNPLLRLDIGADGIKTGYTRESGYGMIASATQGDRRLIAVVNGLEKAKTREEEAQSILEWGFASFQTVPLFARSEILGQAQVFGGSQGYVDVAPRESVTVLLPRGDYGRISAWVEYRGPLRAPVEKGVEVGDLVVRVDGQERKRQKVYATSDVGTGTMPQRALDALYELTLGQLGL
ncbi:MAG: D-alanyl-D-alanine carboxypeptidase family protein [Pseudomonadota bacterium]